MVKQVVTSILWFFTVAWGWNYVALLTGLPSVVGLGLGIVAAAFVWADPFHLIRPARVETHQAAPVQGPISKPIQRPV